MAQVYKVLGQSNPGATTATKLYTVPAATSAVISELVVCERGGAVATFRVSIRVAGAADSAKQYIAYDDPDLGANYSLALAAARGITLGAADEVWVYASSANIAFSLFGAEIT